jgi:DNA topoisomerase-2
MVAKPKPQSSGIRRIAARNFVNTAFKEFSLYDNVRSIPKLTDGLKPSQRKAIHGTQVRGENAGLLSVERLSAHCAASTDYHHGVGSMQSTIIGLANKYAGSNNMNLFEPEGQFGSRLTADPAAARYIETKLTPYFRMLFPKADDCILEYNQTDGEKIEPVTYLPLLPITLVNGAQGTGTGHACLVMAYNPKEIAAACLAVLQGKNLTNGGLTPWYKGFKGSIERNQINGQVVITGKMEVVNTTTIKISELPIGVYLDQYKEHLNKLEDEEFIKDYEDRSTEDGFDFTVIVPRTTSALPLEELYKKFKLVARDTENFTLWGIDGILRRMQYAEEVVNEFVTWRSSMFEIRRQKLIDVAKADIAWASERIRFINFYLKNTNLFKNTGKKDLIELLISNKFTEYERLLAMSIWNLTKDKISELEKELLGFKDHLASLEKDTADKMYSRELKALVSSLVDF